MKFTAVSIVLFVAFAHAGALAADPPKAPVPASPFIRVVYGYADAMLKNGRDKNGLFLSALDRQTLVPLTNRPAAPAGVRESDRVGATGGPLIGSNPYHDENLLRLLATLSDLSAKPHYRAAADAELKWFVANQGVGALEPIRPWLLWDRCFSLSPEATATRARAVTNTTGSTREAGFCVRTWAEAYVQTKDEQCTRAISGWLERFVRNEPRDFTLSLAIDCDGAAHRVPESLAARLRAMAAQQDERFCSLLHNLKKNGGFVAGHPEAQDNPFPKQTLLWKASHDKRTTAQMGMMCVSRYDNAGRVAYRELILAAADLYLDSLPAESDDAWPGTLGHAISLELAAWRHSADWRYMERARKLGDFAVEKYWGTNALPRASLKTDHYESITGADTLALALLELHLQILHITAVRCPANTLDR